jgi:hypothetical protein
MNRQATQFTVSLLGMFFLGLCTILALYADLFRDANSELTFALVTALTGVTGAATAYLFRLNGTSGGS